MDESLKKDVMALKSQGYTETQIKQSLTQKGYQLNSINEAISFIVKENNNQAKPKNKKMIILSIIILILAASILTYYLIPKNNAEIIEVLPSEYAGDWIESINGSTTINITEATNGMSDFEFGRQTFVDDNGDITSIFMIPYYEGKNAMLTDKDMINNRDMNPNDNILEGFSLLKKEEGNFVLYIFLDQDFRNKYRDETHIVWSDNIMNDSSINEIKFDFSDETEGIYFNKLTNMSWITNNVVNGRVYVGNLRKHEVINNNFDKTFFEIS